MKSFTFLAILGLFTYFLSVQTVVEADSSERFKTRLTNIYGNRNVNRFRDGSSDESRGFSMDSSSDSDERRYGLIYWQCELSPMRNINFLPQFPIRRRLLKYFGNMKDTEIFLNCPTELSDFDILLNLKDLQRVSENTLKNMYAAKYYPEKFRPIYVTIIQGVYIFWLPKNISMVGLTSTIKPLTPQSRDGVPKGRDGNQARI